MTRPRGRPAPGSGYAVRQPVESPPLIATAAEAPSTLPCTSTRSGLTPAASATSITLDAARKPVPADLMPGEQIDYAGHRCGNPNLHVKTHVCLFPQRSGTR